MVMLLRTAHYNLAKLRDVYLHTNTLAALANLAPHARGLSSHAAQRLVSLFDMLARRCAPRAQWTCVRIFTCFLCPKVDPCGSVPITCCSAWKTLLAPQSPKTSIWYTAELTYLGRSVWM